ncbi:MAG TPA: hypothetical protein VMW15_07465, partial [Terracidiphilus sp.]|nr:hypothetical protein [Terracidiphilus sp.]
LNTLSLASHLLPPWKCRLVNNILRNETGGSLTLATLTLLQNFTGLILRNNFAKEKGWSKTRVDSFIGDCVSVIEKTITIPDGVRGKRPRDGLCPVTLTIPFDDWLRAKKTVPELPDTIEELCATESMGFAFKRGRHIQAKKYELYFDRGEPFYGHVFTRWTHPKAQADIKIMEHVITVAPAISKDVPALQVADLFAWSINHNDNVSRQWHRRLHSLPYLSALLDYEHLIKPQRWVLEKVAAWGLPRRRSSVKSLSKPKKAIAG